MVAAASVAAFELLQESTHLRDQLEENTLYFRKAMTEVTKCIYTQECCLSQSVSYKQL
jgi:7-keto-8-aminopelargonate synthetase-like enzyme